MSASESIDRDKIAPAWVDSFKAEINDEISLFLGTKAIQRLKTNHFSETNYHTLLLTLFHQSYEGPYNMALAAARCRWQHHSVKEYLLRHAAEEALHWHWIIEDLRSTGYDGPDPRQLRPHWTAETYVSFVERISEAEPFARLATASVLEGIAAAIGRDYGARLLSVLNIKPSQAKFFVNHSETDREHILEIYDCIAVTDWTDREVAMMSYTARTAARFYRAMYDHDGFDEPRK